MVLIILFPISSFAAGGEVPILGPVRVEFIIFGLFLLGCEPADNNEHKIINCPVPGCPMAGQGEKGEGSVSYLELIK